LPLKHQCFSKIQGQYEFEVCFFGEVRQKDTRSNRSYKLGSFEHILRGGKEKNPSNVVQYGLEERDVMTVPGMYFSQGDRCAAKARSAVVHFSCSPENEVLDVSEPEVCLYEIQMNSPIACEEEEKETTGHPGDEL